MRIRNFLFIGSLPVLFLCMPAAQNAIPAHPEQIIYSPLEYQPPHPQDFRDTLANGLVMYLVEDHRVPLVEVTALVRAGSIFEPESLSGLAALTGSLMRSGGTERLTGDALDERIEFLAADLTLRIGLTEGTASLRILKKDADEGLRLFMEMLRSPRFAPEKLDLEKKQMQSVIARRWDDPRNTSAIAFSRFLYSGYPASFLPTEKTVEAIGIQQIREFYARFILPQNIILAVAGDFNRDDMRRQLDTLFGDWRVASGPRPALPEWTQKSQIGNLIFVKQKASQASVKVGHRIPKRPYPDEYALTVLNRILGGGGFSSRLTQRVRSDEGLVYDVRSTLDANYFFPGTFSMALQTKSASAAYALSLCLEEMKTVCREKVATDELVQAKKSLIESFPDLFRLGSDRAENFAWNEYWGRPFDHFDRYREKIQALTPEDLLRSAQAYLHPDSLVFTVTGDPDSCLAGDGIHPVQLSDFGPVKITDLKECQEPLEPSGKPIHSNY